MKAQELGETSVEGDTRGVELEVGVCDGGRGGVEVLSIVRELQDGDEEGEGEVVKVDWGNGGLVEERVEDGSRRGGGHARRFDDVSPRRGGDAETFDGDRSKRDGAVGRDGVDLPRCGGGAETVGLDPEKCDDGLP